jgi:hypothetical protein
MLVGHTVPVLGQACCDFCASPSIVKLYKCANFVFNGRTVFQRGSVGAWAARSRCAQLVDEDRWFELSDRAFRRFAKLHGPISQHDVQPASAVL